jgi:translocation and assembly module TamB
VLDLASPTEDRQTNPSQRKARRLRKALAWSAGGILFSALTAGTGLLWLNTNSGHQFVARQISGLEFANGLHVHVGSIGGNIYGRPTLRRIVLSDRKGVFAKIREAQIVWRSLYLAGRHLDIESTNLRGVELLRLPELVSNSHSERSVFAVDRIDIANFESLQMLVTIGNGGEIISTDVSGAAHIDGNRWNGKIGVRTEDADSGQPKDVIDLKGSGNFALTDLTVDGRIRASANGLIAGFTGKAVPIQATFEDSNSLGPLEPIFD